VPLHRGCRALQELWLRNNHLASLPSNLGRAKRLKKLDVGGNCLEAFPDVSGLRALEALWCFGNRLVTPPPGLAGCAALRVLNLDGNRLTELGTAQDGVAALPNLHTLSAADNRIWKIGRELGHSAVTSVSLRELDLRGNRLTRLPASLGRLRSLFVLRVLSGEARHILLATSWDARQFKKRGFKVLGDDVAGNEQRACMMFSPCHRIPFNSRSEG
jgi:Leucine-rich repeat (LRR) protein